MGRPPKESLSVASAGVLYVVQREFWRSVQAFVQEWRGLCSPIAMNPICALSQSPWTGSGSLLFGTWRELLFANAALGRLLASRNILAEK